jgi:predicted SnoaL-like aldol condensation-catalyzing enzyme
MTKPSHSVEEVKNETPMECLKLVRRYYAAWNRRDIAEIEACVAADMRGHSGARLFDRAALIAFRSQIGSAFAGVHEEDAVAQSGKVALRWTSRWLAQGSDDRVQTHGVTIYRIESGKIAEMWDVRDQPAMPIGLKRPRMGTRPNPNSGKQTPPWLV